MLLVSYKPMTVLARIATSVLVLLLAFGGAVLLEWRGNAFQSEFGDNADEAAHYVTGLMVRDYIAKGFPGPPLAFAQNYYVHYPKVSFGHWPPLFYIVQAAWTLPIQPCRASLMLLMALIAALLAAVVCETLRLDFSLPVGLCGAALLLSLPVVEQFGRDVMAEMLVALLVFLAVLAYGRYLDTERWQPAAWFGLWFALAMLTKGTAIQLALVAPVGAFLRRRLYLMRRFSFWLPALVVCTLAGPWYWWVPGAQHESVARFGGIGFGVERLTGTLLTWFEMLGPVLAAAALLGLCVSVARIRGSGIWSAGVAVLFGAYVARFFVGAFEARHLIVSLPVLVMFAMAGAVWLVRLPSWNNARWVKVTAGALVVVLLAWNIHASPLKRHYGYSEVAQDLLAHREFKDSVILVCGTAAGEGMLISEIAMREQRPDHIILRATKMLASSDWMGWDYEALFHDSSEMMGYLEGIPVGIIVLDREGRLTPHGKMLDEGLQAHPEKWSRLSSASGDIVVYRFSGPHTVPKTRIVIPMRAGLYGTFTNQ